MTTIPQFNPQEKNNNISKYNFANWLEELKHCEFELRACTRNLEKIVLSIECHPQAFPKVEHFQNQFLFQQTNIDKLQIEISRFNHWNKGITSTHDIQKSKQYRNFLDKKMQDFRITFNELIEAFKSFFRKEFLIAHFTF